MADAAPVNQSLEQACQALSPGLSHVEIIDMSTVAFVITATVILAGVLGAVVASFGYRGPELTVGERVRTLIEGFVTYGGAVALVGMLILSCMMLYFKL